MFALFALSPLCFDKVRRVAREAHLTIVSSAHTNLHGRTAQSTRSVDLEALTAAEAERGVRVRHLGERVGERGEVLYDAWRQRLEEREQLASNADAGEARIEVRWVARDDEAMPREVRFDIGATREEHRANQRHASGG